MGNLQLPVMATACVCVRTCARVRARAYALVHVRAHHHQSKLPGHVNIALEGISAAWGINFNFVSSPRSSPEPCVCMCVLHCQGHTAYTLLKE